MAKKRTLRNKYAVEHAIEEAVYRKFPEKSDIPCLICPYERSYRPKNIHVILNEQTKYLETHSVYVCESDNLDSLRPADDWKPFKVVVDCVTGEFSISRKGPTLKDYAEGKDFDYIVVDVFVRLVTEEKIKDASSLRIVKIYRDKKLRRRKS